MFFNTKIKSNADIDILIKNGADINYQETLFGQTYLHLLVKTSSPFLDYFLSKVPNTNIQNKEGRTPIFYANDVETIEKLVKHRASVYIRDFNGKNFIDIKPKLMSDFNKKRKNILGLF